MSENIIELEFKSTLTDLSGNRLGDKVYDTQVSDKIDVERKNIVRFPATVEYVGSSFIEGMYKKLGEKYGKKKAAEIMEMTSENEECKKKIEKSRKAFGV